MKQIFLTIAITIMIAASKNAGAQWNNDVNLNSKAANKKKITGRSKNVDVHVLSNFTNSSRILSETKMTNVNIKAVRHFSRSYKNIQDAKWFQTEGGHMASFISNEIFTKVFYDDEGMWFYNLLEYTEAKLPFEIRHIVKRKYYDGDIFVVHQYEFYNDKTVYIIRMYDQHSKIKTVKVCEEEIEDITQREKN